MNRSWDSTNHTSTGVFPEGVYYLKVSGKRDTQYKLQVNQTLRTDNKIDLIQYGFNTFVNLNGELNAELTDLYRQLFPTNSLLSRGVVTNMKDFMSGLAKEWGLNQG